MGHVFISYSQQDKRFAQTTQDRLEAADLKVWRAVRLRGGEDWRQGIDDAIRKAWALVVIMSPDAKASEYVTYEWAFASGAGIKLIPVLLRQTELHPRLAFLQHLDFTSRQTRPWSQLVNLLSELNASERMMKLLKDERYEWRSLARLALKGKIPKDKAYEILERDANVEFKDSATLGRLARLKSR